MTDGRADASPDERRERRFFTAVGAMLGAMVVLAGIDLAVDFGEGTTPVHVAVEGLIAACGLLGVGLIVRRLRHTTRRARERARDLAVEAEHLTRRLEATRAEAERWRREAGALLAGLGAAIDAQLTRWQLSRAEREVALLLLKGLSHKEIAAARGVSQATVRQQAQAVYRKAGVSGRSDLSAFFLEDLLLPPAAAPRAPTA